MDQACGEIDLVVFADDWGRHPSSAQHLVKQLLPNHPTLWVNTVGTRRVRLTAGDLRRVAGKVREWLGPAKPQAELPAHLRVLNPRMYPGFRAGWQRRLNARWMANAVNRTLHSSPLPSGGAGGGGLRQPDASNLTTDSHESRPNRNIVTHALPEAPSSSPSRREGGKATRTAVTTLPITADLVGKLDVDHWVYYCVDDFSAWPGLDSAVMQAMEREFVAKVDAIVCVSEVLRERVRGMGREAELLTHGVDLAAFDTRTITPVEPGSLFARWEAENDVAHTFGFWGLIDRRLDPDWVHGLTSTTAAAALFLAGPRQDPPPGLFDRKPPAIWCGELPYDELRDFAAVRHVLVMPYIDAPVTRAMQPLKLLEYLSTYKPVVVRDLPATRAWADCCDVVSTAEEFVRVCLERAKTGLPAEQRVARDRRLPSESWAEKARRFEAVLFDKGGNSR